MKKEAFDINITKAELDSVFENYSIISLLNLMDKQFPNMYNQDVGVFEGYTLYEHTFMVLSQFEKYYCDKILPGKFNKDVFRLFLALHDIGKPIAVYVGDLKLQHQYSSEYITILFEFLQISLDETRALMSILNFDLGDYLRGRVSIEQTRESLIQLALNASMSLNESFELIVLYFKVDAGSYTENAGGIYSLDNLFVFDEESLQINLASEVQSKIDLVFIDFHGQLQIERMMARRIRLNNFNSRFKRGL